MEEKKVDSLKYTKKQKWQIAAKITAFVLVIALVVCVLNDIFNYPNSTLYVKRYHTYNTLEENTVDAVYIGSSVVDRSWCSTEAYSKYGMTVYPYSSDAVPCVLSKYMMKEAEKTQNPKLWIFDIRNFTTDPTADGQAEKVRRVTDLWPLSKNKIEALNSAFVYLKQNEEFKNDSSWYIPLVKYHGRWDYKDENVIKLSEADFTNGKDKYMGAYASKTNSGMATPYKQPETSNEKTPIPENCETVLRDLLDYLKQTNKNVLFVCSPNSSNSGVLKEYNYIFSVIEEYGFDYLNFNTEEMYKKIDLDFESDFYDTIHLNIKGALKYTEYFSNYLNENYNLPDRRNDKNYSNWQEAAEKYEVFKAEYLEKLEKSRKS